METGDEEDEWRREEELANMAAQTHLRAAASPNAAEMSVARGSLTPPAASSRPTMLHGSVTLQGSYSAQTSLTGESGTQVRDVRRFSFAAFLSALDTERSNLSVFAFAGQTLDGISAAPWVLTNSRKRTVSIIFLVKILHFKYIYHI